MKDLRNRKEYHKKYYKINKEKYLQNAKKSYVSKKYKQEEKENIYLNNLNNLNERLFNIENINNRLNNNINELLKMNSNLKSISDKLDKLNNNFNEFMLRTLLMK